MPQPLGSKVAVVTGGGRGIGRAIALGFAAAGADVCVVARSRNEVEEVAGRIEASGRRSLAVCCDVGDCEAVDAAIARVGETFGGIDILVANAGGEGEAGRVGEDDADRWVAVIRVHLLGAYFSVRAALPLLRARGGGKVILVGSGLGHEPQAGNSSYSAAKAALWMLTRCLALELRDEQIAVNELIPGLVHTASTTDAFDKDGRLINPSLAHEWAKTPDDVIPIALFLATQPPKGPTGQSFSLARRPL